MECQSYGQGLLYQPECQQHEGMASLCQHLHHHGPKNTAAGSKDVIKNINVKVMSSLDLCHEN